MFRDNESGFRSRIGGYEDTSQPMVRQYFSRYLKDTAAQKALRITRARLNELEED